MRILFLASCIVLFTASFSTAQQKKGATKVIPRVNRDSLPCVLNPRLPAFNILTPDSTTIFNTFSIPKGKPVALMLLSPDCEHCHKIADEIGRGMDSLSGIRFYLISISNDIAALRKFCEQHQLLRFSNIEVVGSDYEFFFVPFFGAAHLPTVALYDANKKFVKLIESPLSVKHIYDASNK